jgi:hypothetical protein
MEVLKNDFGRKAKWTYFPNPQHRKNRIERKSLSEVLFRRMALRTHNLNVLKCDFCDVAVAMFHDVERPFKRIFYILELKKLFVRIPRDVLRRRVDVWTHILLNDVLKNDFAGFYEALYQDVERPYELIFCFLRIKKIVLNEDA